MEKKNMSVDENKNAEMQMDELNLDDIENVAGGGGLRNVERVQTHDIDDNTRFRV